MVNKTLKGTLLCTVALAGGLLAQNTTANADSITVKAGDTLSSLALTHNTTVSSLKETNHLQDENKIFVGDKLETSTNVNQDNNTYTVVAGDTLSKIADEHNLTVANLKAYNNLTSDLIMVGQVLQLAGQTSAVDNTPTQTQTQNDTQQTQTAVAQPKTYTQPQQTQQTQQAQQPQTSTSQSQTTTPQLSGSEEQAKAWIANKESGGSYDARNGRYVGKYQLDSSYLHGDYSAENQERTAQNYIQSRYGSWQSAQQFWINNGWY
ncbi:LysM peptidoglycan-binding domain-containing protein [Ligilactobacillus agilis]|nr:LysM peptidoglycan-binding domain-containing protein [Ligilactobacillus agilis]